MKNGNNIFKSLWTKGNNFLPKENMLEFRREVAKDNYFRLSIISITLFVLEIFLYFIQEKIFNVGPIILRFLVTSGILLPFIWYVRRNIETVHLVFASLVQFAYCLFCLAFGASLAVHIQGDVDLIHMYLLFVFFAAAFVYMNPLASGVLFLVSFLHFVFSLSHYVENPNAIFVILTNTGGSNIAAWVMSNIMWKSKISVFNNRNLLHKQNSILKDMSQKDLMTGLFNHDTSLKLLDREIQRSEKLHCSLSLIIADIDDFKSVNDTYGHLIGDHVIKIVAQTISSTVRKTDFVGRYGGEEFIIIMPQTDLKAARALSERIQSGIHAGSIHEGIHVTLSGGISQYHDESLNAFLRMTDQKLYIAKSSGKNRFEAALVDQPETLPVNKAHSCVTL